MQLLISVLKKSFNFFDSHYICIKLENFVLRKNYGSVGLFTGATTGLIKNITSYFSNLGGGYKLKCSWLSIFPFSFKYNNAKRATENKGALKSFSF